MTKEQSARLVPEKAFVMYAGAPYKVESVSEQFGVTWISIYDEPPSQHVDKIKAESCEPIHVGLLTTCLYDAVRKAKLGSTIHPKNEVDAIIELLKHFENKFVSPE